MTLFSTAAPELIEMHGGEILYFKNFLSESESREYYRLLSESLIWDQPLIMIKGKKIPIPRLQAWYGDEGTIYQYSGIKMTPNPWTRELEIILNKVCKTTGHTFNSVLANWYQHGGHSIGMHSDDEPELGNNPVIAAVSLGETRRLRFRSKITNETLNIEPEDGSLLIMQGEIQKNWQHEVVKTKKAVAGRISLTYRQIQS